MKGKQIAFLSIGIVLILAIIGVSIYFAINQQITGFDCYYSWQVSSYDKSTGTITLSSAINGLQGRQAGCIGTHLVANEKVNINNQQDCEFYGFGWQYSTYYSTNVCKWNGNWTDDKTSIVSGTCINTCVTPGSTACNTQPYAFTGTFDGATVGFPGAGPQYYTRNCDVRIDLRIKPQPTQDTTTDTTTTCPALNSLNCNDGYKEVITTDTNGCQINSCVLESTTTTTNTSTQTTNTSTSQTKEEKGINPLIYLGMGLFLLLIIIVVILLTLRRK